MQVKVELHFAVVFAALHGLGPDFRDFATSLCLCAESVSFVELTGLLRSHESFMCSSSDVAAITTANLASSGSNVGIVALFFQVPRPFLVLVL